MDNEVFQETVRRAKQEAIKQALARADGNVAEAAARLGIRRTSLYRIMKRYGIDSPTQAEGRTGT